MSCKRCDLCRQSVVSWPGVFTVIGPLDLCGVCYWRYRAIVESLAEFFNQFGRVPAGIPRKETEHA